MIVIIILILVEQYLEKRFNSTLYYTHRLCNGGILMVYNLSRHFMANFNSRQQYWIYCTHVIMSLAARVCFNDWKNEQIHSADLFSKSWFITLITLIDDLKDDYHISCIISTVFHLLTLHLSSCIYIYI